MTFVVFFRRYLALSFAFIIMLNILLKREKTSLSSPDRTT